MSACMLILHKGHTDTIWVYSVTVMTHVKALQAGHSSKGTSESITPGIPSDELHTTTLSIKYYRSALFMNTRQTATFFLSPQEPATSPATVSCNDTRLLGDLNPPTMAHNTRNTYPHLLWPIIYRQHCPIVTRVAVKHAEVD